jgi:hypothetical protein
MARKKLFYTKNQITENLYTAGNEFQLSDGTMYIGLYHRYDTGELYTGGTWNVKTSKPLSVFVQTSEQVKLYRQNKKDIKTKFKSPVRYIPQITAVDTQKTYVTRYFLYKLNDKNVIEIDQPQYSEWANSELDNNIYKAIKTIWYITGNATTTQTGGITQLGVIQKNQNIIDQLEQTYPGFRDTINNPLELYIDTTIIVPPAIN